MVCVCFNQLFFSCTLSSQAKVYTNLYLLYTVPHSYRLSSCLCLCQPTLTPVLNVQVYILKCLTRRSDKKEQSTCKTHPCHTNNQKYNIPCQCAFHVRYDGIIRSPCTSSHGRNIVCVWLVYNGLYSACGARVYLYTRSSYD